MKIPKLEYKIIALLEELDKIELERIDWACINGQFAIAQDAV